MFIGDVRGGVAENTAKCGLQFLHIALNLSYTQVVDATCQARRACRRHSVYAGSASQLHALGVVHSNTLRRTTASLALLAGEHSRQGSACRVASGDYPVQLNHLVDSCVAERIEIAPPPTSIMTLHLLQPAYLPSP